MEVHLIAVCEDSPALSHLKELSPQACFQDFSWRVSLEWVPASEGRRFDQVVAEMAEQVRKVDPGPSRTQ